MAQLLRTCKGRLLHSLHNPPLCSRPHTSLAAPLKSPLESHILRILRKKIEYHLLYFPPFKPVSQYDTFSVEDHPGEQYITLKRKFSDNENVKIKATMSDGFVVPPQANDKGLGSNSRLHLSLVINVSKGEGLECLEFVCSAWPDRLEIQKVFISSPNEMSMRPYMGPNIRTMKRQFQTEFYDYLKMRGVHDDLSVFLHVYMMNKARIEMVRWLKKAETFVES